MNEYWGNELTCKDAPTARHHEFVAMHLNECMVKAGKLPPEYVKHVYEYRAGEGHAVGACCITGAMPKSMTSKRDYKEIPWPLTPPTK